MGFGCGHLPINDEIHEASWGARLIYNEVTSGQAGKGFAVVWDRQTPNGEPDTVRSLFPVLERAVDEFRKPENMYELDGGQSGHLCWREGRILVVMSPQGSYGYLYITAVLEKEGHEGESEIWGTNGEWAEGELAKRVQLGNWPPEVVAEREAKRLKQEREYALGALRYAKWDSDDALRKVWRAKTERSKKMAQNKLAKMDDVLAAARQKAFALGFTEEEIDRAQRGY